MLKVHGKTTPARTSRPRGPAVALAAAALMALSPAAYAAPAASAPPASPANLAASTPPAAPAAILPPYQNVANAPKVARDACKAWQTLNWKTGQTGQWLVVPKKGGSLAGRDIYTGGTFGNKDGQLPKGGSYQEFDVPYESYKAGTVWKHYGKKDGRGDLRLVRDAKNKRVWYTANHYRDYREIQKGC
ncbi:ribonuclease domain-containing protein [Streptomyces sp. NPDC050610]|uniref:ribonuclease domain-containing protein n=1 Tax=Streptomyces sp. NPDC050610 TaxID=3157097 RepID=UPI0034179FC3